MIDATITKPSTIGAVRRPARVRKTGGMKPQFEIPDLRRFYAFIVVAEELNFGRAARRLKMCQSPLSRMIMNLEDDVGCVLFTRNRRVVRLTPAGESMLPDARRILEEATAAARRARSASK